MANGVGLSTVSDLVRQTTLRNQQQYNSAQQGLKFAQTAIKTTKLTNASQQTKLDSSFGRGDLSQEDYERRTTQLRQQLEIDSAPWEIYVKKLSQLIEKYSNRSEPDEKKKPKRVLEPVSTTNPNVKRTRITFSSSSSSDSDTPEAPPPPPPVVAPKPSKPASLISKHDSSTNTDPLELSLRSSFPSTPNNIPFTAQTNRVIHRVPLQHINETAAQQIVLLHDEGHLVRWNDVVWRILLHYDVQDLGHLGLQRADQIACIDNLVRTQNKINTYLDGYAYWQMLGTLNELEADLARIFHKNDYQELLLGPVEKQPKVEELFRLRSVRFETVRKDLKCADVLKYLDQYMTKEHAWRMEKDIQLEDFLKFIAEQVQVKSVYQLGIRIKSVYLARNCIKAMQANQRKTMDIARAELNQMLVNLVQVETKKVLRTMNAKLGNRHAIDEQRELYATMDPIDIIQNLIELCRGLCQDSPSFRKLSHALQIIGKDAMLRNIFQIALCHGRLAQSETPVLSVQEVDRTARVNNKKIYFSSSSSSDASDHEMETTQETPPEVNVIVPPIRLSEEEMLRALKEQMGSLQTLTFAHLARMEQRLCEQYGVQHFEDLSHGTFLKYIEQNEQSLFSDQMSFQLVSSSREESRPTPQIVSREELNQFLLHAREKLFDQPSVEPLLCYHFQVQSVEELGYGTFRSIWDSLEEEGKPIDSDIHYECLVVDDLVLTEQASNSAVDDLQKQAWQALDECPLLGDLALDTQWNIRYRPVLGPLKPFLVQHHRCPWLEVDYGTFLKLSSTSNIDQFKQSLSMTDPIETAGHLVSILVQSNFFHHAPLSLLATILQTFYSRQQLDQSVYAFVVAVLVRIPTLILFAVLQRIFLEPLIKVEGSQRTVREKLWQIIETRDSDQRRRFIRLGEQLGFSEWSMVKIKLEPFIPYEQEPTMTTPRPLIVSVSPYSSPAEMPVSIRSSTRPAEVIERIRREKFGIGLTLSDESEQLTNQLKSLVGRSLERLSKELYNSDMHFVLELIQNADDNQYNQLPALVFVVDTNAIQIYNNELGFEEHHIQALCDIGKSTKGKHQQGYIGQKGIGFKSVFTISDRPEIYSNGYQICFDAQSGPIGYILPSWLDEDQREQEYSTWTTRISLPLKSENERQKHRSRSLIESFQDIQSSLLLFLNRLRSITIDNRLTRTRQIYQRIDHLGTSVVEIHGGLRNERWFVLKKQVSISEEMKNHCNEKIQATEIALAFPLHEIQANGRTILTKKEVFAYLPLRTFGFTFIIQADFEVPSSRQDILSDSIWNQYLLQEIPSLFLSALDAFQREQTSLPVDALRLFLQFLPQQTSIFGPHLFTSISRTIFQSLRSRHFLPVLNDHHLHMPHECVLTTDASVKDILTPELLYMHLNLYYLPEDLYEYHHVLYELGVHRLGHQELIEVMKRMLTSEVLINDRAMLGKWLHCLYRCFHELSLIDEEQVLNHLRALKIIPLLRREEFLCLNQTKQKIFFPAANLHLSRLIEDDLLIIDERLWSQLEENSVARLQVQTLLERLGLQRLNHRAICEQHIFPICENESLWREKSSELRIAYVMCLFDLWSKEKQSIDLTRWKSIIHLSTNAHFRSPEHNSIHFSTHYGNPCNLLEDFPTYPWLLLSDGYLRHASSSVDRRKLRQFFAELGVRDFLFPIDRWTCEQFDALVERRSVSMNRKLFLVIQEHWSTLNEVEQNELMHSSLFQHCKQFEWIPTVQICYSVNEQQDQIDSTPIQALHPAAQTYMRSKVNERLLAGHVAYLDADLTVHASFAIALGLIEQIAVPQLIATLLQWSQSIFCTSLAHMQNVYDYLGQHMNREDLRQLIEHHPIVFVPEILTERTAIVRGKFCHRSQVCWQDPSNLLRKYSPTMETKPRAILDLFYAEQKSLFLDILTIPLHPTIDEYIALLVHLASLNKPEDVYSIYTMMGQWCQQTASLIDQEDLQNRLSNKAVFPTRNHRWVSLSGNPLMIDNDELAQLFSSVDALPLLKASSTDLVAFFRLCGIRSLSSTTSMEHLVDSAVDDESIRHLFSLLIPYVQLFMKSRAELSEAYQWTRSTVMHSVLKRMQFQTVDRLQVIYRCRDDLSIHVTHDEKTSYDADRGIFYIHRSWSEQSKHYRDIFHAFARLFLPNPQQQLIRLLGNFLHLLHNEEETNLESFAKYQQFDLELNDTDDVPWTIPSAFEPEESESTIADESKVRALLANVAENQEQYLTYRQKKRQELKKQLSVSPGITEKSTTSEERDDTVPRFDGLRPVSIIDTPCEIVEEHTKHFTLEDLTHQVLDNRHSPIGSDQKSLEKIGRWGEQWVNEYLLTKYREQIQSNEMKVLWLNENQEQGKPYDFILEYLSTKRTTYIEVKSTLSHRRQLIPITFNELNYCCSLSDSNEDFVVYRVYNTGRLNKVQLRIVQNIEEKLRRHALELFLLI